MIRALTFLSVLSFLSVPSVLFSQQNTAVMVQGTNLVPTNAAGVISNALGLGPFATNTSLAVSNISGLQAALDGKLATNGMLAVSNVSNFSQGVTNALPAWSATTNPATVRTNLGILPVGTTAGTVAAGDDARITNAVQRGEQVGYATNAFFASSSTTTYRLADSSTGENVLGRNTAQGWLGDLSGLAAALNAASPHYAVFDIPLGGAYTDFELKASTSNFATNSTYTNGMVFFYHSPDPGKSAIPEQIWTTRPDVFFTDSAWTGATNYMNQRSWRKQSASQSIAAMRAGGVNSVIAGVVVVVRDTGVINPTNAALVWSYCRYTPTAYEADGGGRSIWVPVTPRWVSQPFVP